MASTLAYERALALSHTQTQIHTRHTRARFASTRLRPHTRAPSLTHTTAHTVVSSEVRARQPRALSRASTPAHKRALLGAHTRAYGHTEHCVPFVSAYARARARSRRASWAAALATLVHRPLALSLTHSLTHTHTHTAACRAAAPGSLRLEPLASITLVQSLSLSLSLSFALSLSHTPHSKMPSQFGCD